MGSLDLATQQLVVIARALSKSLKLLILDEPTAALTENKSSGCSNASGPSRLAASRSYSFHTGWLKSSPLRIVSSSCATGAFEAIISPVQVSRADVVTEMLGEPQGATQSRRLHTGARAALASGD